MPRQLLAPVAARGEANGDALVDVEDVLVFGTIRRLLFLLALP